MQKVESYASLSPVLEDQLKPGVRTNCTLGRTELEREIAAETLYAGEWPGGLALLCRRDGCDRLFYYLTDPLRPWTGPFPRDTVLEIPWRERDGAPREAAFWEAAGFRRLLERRRMTRPAGPAAGPAAVQTAGEEDLDALRRLMAESFHPLAGWQPTEEELARAAAAGEILCVRDEAGQAAGLLHYIRKWDGTELRHLAVRQDMRRRGLASGLFAGYMAATAGARSRVWVVADNVPARAFYRQCGYEDDGWRSAVWVYHDGKG